MRAESVPARGVSDDALFRWAAPVPAGAGASRGLPDRLRRRGRSAARVRRVELRLLRPAMDRHHGSRRRMVGDPPQEATAACDRGEDMTELFSNLATYLRDVFIIKFDGWVVLGFVAQGFFTMRFVVQWIASERARKSVIPVAFWFFSIGGGVLLLVYALYRRDPVFIAGQALGLVVYVRNLYFIVVNGRQASAEG